jgi:hypothetical protein
VVDGAPIEQRIGGVRRPQHDVRDPAGLDGRIGHDGVDRGGDAAGDVSRGGALCLRHQCAGAVEHDRIGVRPADVDPEPQVDRAGHAASSSTGT